MLNTYILVCDDEPAVREVISVVLSMAGYDVETATNGVEALKMIRGKPEHYSLLLTDHAMEPLNGLDLVRELRNGGFSGKIIVLSGRLDHTDISAYTGLAVDGIMLKPFNFTELRKTISSVLSLHPHHETVSNVEF